MAVKIRVSVLTRVSILMSPQKLPIAKLPAIAQPVAELVEKFFTSYWSYDYEYPVPDSVESVRLQIRDPKHYTPIEEVRKYRENLKNKAKFPPPIVTSDGFTVDGNTRLEANRQNGIQFVQAIVLDVKWLGAKQHEVERLHMLGAAANCRNGRGIDKKEIRNAIEHVRRDPDFTQSKIAALIGIKASTVSHYINEARARERLEKLGVHVNGSVGQSVLGELGNISSKINDEPFAALGQLVADSGLGVADVRNIAKEMFRFGNDDQRIAVVNKDREARRDQISLYAATGKSKPPLSGILRQRLGILLKDNNEPSSFVELNPSVTTEHKRVLYAAKIMIEKIIAAQK